MNDNKPKTHAMNIGDLGRVQMEDTSDVAIRVQDLDLYYGDAMALKNVSMSIPRNRVTAFIGPSGCGKSTLLRCFNRMNDLVDICRVDGKILLDDKNIYDKDVNVALLRRRVGMVFQKPNPFPKSIYENVAYGLRIMGVNNRSTLDEAVDIAGFFYRSEIDPAPDLLVGKGMTPAQSAQAARQAGALLEGLPDFSPATAEAPLRALADELGLSAGQLFGILRIAVTGQPVSPPLLESMEILGRALVLERIDRAVSALESRH